MSNLKAKEYKTFESIKHIFEDGNEFWYARELVCRLSESEYNRRLEIMKIKDLVIA